MCINLYASYNVLADKLYGKGFIRIDLHSIVDVCNLEDQPVPIFMETSFSCFLLPRVVLLFTHYYEDIFHLYLFLVVFLIDIHGGLQKFVIVIYVPLEVNLTFYDECYGICAFSQKLWL